MATIVDGPKPDQVTCRACKATIAFMPEEVERYDGRDISGGPDGYERVKCPRPSCPSYGYVRSW